MATARDLVTGFNIGRDMVANLRRSRDEGRRIDIADATLKMQQDLNNLSIKRFEDATGALGEYTTGIGKLNPDAPDYYSTINRMKQKLGPTISKNEKVSKQYQIFNQSLEESEKYRIGQHKVNSRMAAKATKIQNIANFESFHGVEINPSDPLALRSVSEWVGGNKIVDIFRKYGADYTEEDREKIGKYTTTHGGPSPEQLLIAENIAKRSGFMSSAKMESDAENQDRQSRMNSMGMSLGSAPQGVPGSTGTSDVEFFNQPGVPPALVISSANMDKNGFVSYSFGPKKDQELKLTEAQSKDLTFLGIMEDADKVMAGQEFDPTTLNAWFQSVKPNFAQSDEFQVFRVASEMFYSAHQRDISGAAISEIEMKRASKLWVPNPGDGPEAVKTKQNARNKLMQLMASTLPKEALNKSGIGLAPGLAPKNVSGGASAAPEQKQAVAGGIEALQPLQDRVNDGSSPAGTYTVEVDGVRKEFEITKDVEFLTDNEKEYRNRYLNPKGEYYKEQMRLKALMESIGEHKMPTLQHR